MKRTILVIVVVLMLISLLYFIFRDNIHTVTAGRFYRSAQLSMTRLKALIRHDHIRTIINLRGPNPQFQWYRDEISVSRSMGVGHDDIRLSSTHKPRPAQLRRLIVLYETAPKPILVHCQGGADRTGFVSSMWLLMQGDSLAQAKRAYSLIYFVHDSNTIGRLVMPYYERWLARHHYKTNKKHFLQWVAVATL